jgi:hypothetical protein
MSTRSLHAELEQERLQQRWDLSFIQPALADARAYSVALRAPAPHRFPFDPIVRLARLRGIEHVTELAVWLGCSREQVYRMRAGMSWITADRVATSLNMHPTALWPDWADHIDLEAAS